MSPQSTYDTNITNFTNNTKLPIFLRNIDNNFGNFGILGKVDLVSNVCAVGRLWWYEKCCIVGKEASNVGAQQVNTMYQYIADTWLQVLIIINTLAQKLQAIPSHREWRHTSMYYVRNTLVMYSWPHACS